MNEKINGSEKIKEKVQELFLPECIRPTSSVVDVLHESREMAIALTNEVVLKPAGAIAKYFGIPVSELVLEALADYEADEDEPLEVNGVREMAAATAYWDMRGGMSLHEVAKGMHASPVVALRFAAQEYIRRGRVQELANSYAKQTGEEKQDGTEMGSDEGKEDEPATEENSNDKDDGEN
ncbi:MAG: hypothetical protein NC081_05345 [Roseburia sp.]|nr:hypothetical protein [Lachnospiraceae bacterium]MCM1568857.1 hypothetical protein [Roseburia sp.]